MKKTKNKSLILTNPITKKDIVIEFIDYDKKEKTWKGTKKTHILGG